MNDKQTSKNDLVETPTTTHENLKIKRPRLQTGVKAGPVPTRPSSGPGWIDH